MKLSEKLKATRWTMQASPLDGQPYRCVTMEDNRIAQIEQLEADSELLNELAKIWEKSKMFDLPGREAIETAVKKWRSRNYD